MSDTKDLIIIQTAVDETFESISIITIDSIKKLLVHARFKERTSENLQEAIKWTLYVNKLVKLIEFKESV